MAFRPSARIVVLAATAACAVGQLQFEVASVKPAGPASKRSFRGGPGTPSPTSFTASAAMMKDLIAQAYGVSFFQISSKQSLEDLYDINLLIPEGTSKEQFQAMLRRLLSERFHLKASLEKKDFPAFELVVARSGLKLKERVPGADPQPVPQGFPPLASDTATWIQRNIRVDGYSLSRLSARQQPVALIAEIGGNMTPNREPIVDHTGIAVKFDFFLEYAVDIPGATPQSAPPAPSLFTAVREQLGLELISKKLPFDHVIVESFDRVPTEN